ncbi:MAG: M1 family metallopeptidase [Microscillaceae bacterium]|nr:M1 family metallopeptidase [Microscillaceae bacterium]
MKFLIIHTFLILWWAASSLQAQEVFTIDDTLRGSITPERVWWDLTYYDLQVKVNPSEKFIQGSTHVFYKVLNPAKVMQIDLQPPLIVEKVLQDGKELSFQKKGKNAYFIQLNKPQQKGKAESITVFYSGKPKEATRPPWDGGFQWTKDSEGNDFIATSCQGLGASVWWPCKDHMYDEPDSMLISVTVPKPLQNISNGRLRKITDNQDNTQTFTWFVSNPINNYGVNVNIGNYAHFSDTLQGEKGVLDLEYYVLSYNLEKAKEQFKQVKPMLRAFEYWFGPYPFYEDSYKLVEVPYLGMEHQSSVTYGNQYKNGYLGRDLSGTGWGLKWDFIIIHESGHEWFANNITYKDIADMWIHESFTNYSENLFTEYMFGKKAGAEYVIGTRKGIRNTKPIIGIYHLNSEGSGDMYSKGGNMLHTIRQIVDNDEKWRQILRGLNQTFYHQTVDSKQIEAYIIDKSNKKLDKVFDQYLRDIRIPVLEYKIVQDQLQYRWNNCVPNFDMPVKVSWMDEKYEFIYPKTTWQSKKISNLADIQIDKNFYIESKKITE